MVIKSLKLQKIYKDSMKVICLTSVSSKLQIIQLEVKTDQNVPHEKEMHLIWLNMSLII